VCLSVVYVCVLYECYIERKHLGLNKEKKKKKQITHHRADDGKKDHPQPFTFAYIHINVSTYMCIVIYRTPVCIEGNLL